MSVLRRLIEPCFILLKRLEIGIGIAGLTAITLLVFAQVVNRYLLHFEVVWFGDLALYCFIFFMLIAAAITTWNEGHVSVDVLPNRLFAGKTRQGAAYDLGVKIYMAVATIIFLTQAYRFMARAIHYPEYGTLVPWFNTSWLQTTLFVAYSLVLLHILVLACRDFRAMTSSSGGDDYQKEGKAPWRPE